MGALLGKWKSPKSSKETLQSLEQTLSDLTKKRASAQQWERSLIGVLLVVFLLGYPLVCGLGYLFLIHWSSNIKHQLMFALGTVLFPLVCYAEKKLLNMYCSHRKSYYDHAIQSVNQQKKDTLDNVMEKEPYRVAKELLEQYAPSHPALVSSTPRPEPPNNSRGLRQRNVAATPAPVTPHPALQHQIRATPGPSRPPPPPPPPPPSTPRNIPQRRASIEPAAIPPGFATGPAPGPPAPVPILPRERSTLDKLTDFLVGDGPGSRYALICSQCHSHNGMALKDDFEYTTFRCAYCYHLNPARKQKPMAVLPPSDPSQSISLPTGSSDGQCSEEQSASEPVSGDTSTHQSKDPPKQDAKDSHTS